MEREVEDMVRSKDYYTLLGVSRDASKADIQKAYRKLARKFHPDVNKDGDAAEKFKMINEAHATLVNPEKRKLYDQFGENWEQMQHSSHNGGGYQQRENPWQNFGGDFRQEYRQHDFSGEQFEDIFSSIFGEGGFSEKGWQRSRDHEGRTIEAEIEVSLYELARGATKTISWSSMNGQGGVNSTESVNVKIPKGLKDGSVIRLAGKGETGTGRGRAGDLLLRIRVAQDSRFNSDGYNLITTLPVAPWEAALGGKVKVTTLDGEISLNLPQACQSGRKLRVKGKGLPKKNGGAGDLFVIVEVQVPKSLSEEEKRLFEELRNTSRFNPRYSYGQRPGDMKKAA